MFKNVNNLRYDLIFERLFFAFVLLCGFDINIGPNGVDAYYTTEDPWVFLINFTYTKNLPTFLPKSKSTPSAETEDFIEKWFIPLTSTTEKVTININLEESDDAEESESVTEPSVEYDTFGFDKNIEDTVTWETFPPTTITTYSHVKKQPQKKTTWLKYPRVTLVAHKYARTYFIKAAKRKWWVWNDNYTTYDISARRGIRRKIIREQHRKWHSLRVERRKIPTSPKTTPTYVYIRPDYPDPYFYRINTKDWWYNTHQWNDTFEELPTEASSTLPPMLTAQKSKYELRREKALLEEQMKHAKSKEKQALVMAERRAARLERERIKKERMKAEAEAKKREEEEMIRLGIPITKTSKTHEQIASEMARRFSRRRAVHEGRMRKKGITFTEAESTTEYKFAVFDTKSTKILSKAEKERQDKLRYLREKKAQRDKRNKKLRRAQDKAQRKKKPAKSGGGRVVEM